MIRTIVIPKNTDIHLSVPINYIGREIEVLLYAKDELEVEKIMSKKTLADFTGVLSENDYQSLKIHTEQARKEWNRDI